jgi:hypothetical protein
MAISRNDGKGDLRSANRYAEVCVSPGRAGYQCEAPIDARQRVFSAAFPAYLAARACGETHPALADGRLLRVAGAEQGTGIWNWVRLPFQGVLIAWAWWYTRLDAVEDASRIR